MKLFTRQRNVTRLDELTVEQTDIGLDIVVNAILELVEVVVRDVVLGSLWRHVTEKGKSW
jgi:phosphoribosylaminoimidazole-succinocarboxamide synthase